MTGYPAMESEGPGGTVRKRCPDFAAILSRSAPDASLREQIIECFAEEMKRIALHRCESGPMSEDAYQEAMLIFLQALPGYRGDAPIRFWLRRLVFTACSRMRRGRRNDPRFNFPLDELSDAPDAMVEQQRQEMAVMLNERLELLQLVMGEVPEPNRSLLLLHENEELSLQELSCRFDLTVDSVKARLKRTRSALRQRLLALAEEPV